MKKIEVKVCLGTTCFVMGSSYLQELTEIIPKKYGDKVEILSSPCLGLCSIDWEYSRAPYVKVDEQVVYEATVEKVLKELDKKLQNEQ
jgi:NADH:ubiquinone oxidoreductase subunit E